jgi:hypothetical protein
MVLKGALISFMPTFIGAVPNVVIFQINPETITHAWTTPDPAESDGKTGSDPLAVAGLPGETFAFTLEMDANDTIADGDTQPADALIATASGIYSRLAALEMLQYPASVSDPPLVGTVSAASNAAATGLGGCGKTTPQSVPRLQVPTVLFVWGLGRIVPVRVMELTVNEKLYDRFLNPTHAAAQITLKVLTLDDVVSVPQPMKAIATAAYVYTQGLRQSLAAANLSGPTATLLGMLPIPF